MSPLSALVLKVFMIFYFFYRSAFINVAFWWALEPDQKLAVLTQNSSTKTSHSGAPPKMGRPPRSIPAKQTSEELASSISVQNDPEPKAMVIGKQFFFFFLLIFF